MKASDFIESIQTFLMDILAFLIPGAVFLIITWFIVNDEIQGVIPSIVSIPPISAPAWFILGLVSYVSGYILQGIGEAWITRVAERVSRFPISKWLLPGIQRYEDLAKQINESHWFSEARRRIASYTQTDLSSLDFREMRNIAMSMSPSWVRYVYRYTYTWQLCLGVATGMVISIILILLLALFNLIPTSGISFSLEKLWWLLPLFFGVVFLLNRRYRYYSIAMRIPFSIALADIPKLESQSYEEESRRLFSRTSYIKETQMGIPKVYLAGGFHSGWQDKVMSGCPGFEFYDPRTHRLALPEHYKVWDLSHVKQSDILFAVMDRDNPSGYGMALEIGYAKGLDKTVIVVDEKSGSNEEFRKYFAIVKETADAYFQSLDEGITFLKSFETESTNNSGRAT